MELLLVLIVVSILLSLAAPSLKSFSEGRKLRTAAESIRHLCFFARDTAMTEGEAFAVVLDLDNQRYWLTRASALESTELALTVGLGAFGGAEDSTASSGSQTVLTASRVVGVLGQMRDITSGIAIARAEVDRGGTIAATETGLDYILFGRHGTAEPASIYLRSSAGRAVVLDVPYDAAHMNVRTLSGDDLATLGLDVGAM